MTIDIAFLGLGTMGIGMVRRLLASPEFKISVWNRDAAKAAPLAAEGAAVASTPAEAAAHAQFVIAMLADDTASRAVWLGDPHAAGALAAAPAGAILIDCSTLTIRWVYELAAAAAKRGLKFLDAPVTGTKPHAANGELTFLVGGDAVALEAARPILAPMAKEIIHLGPTGAGAAIKLINNFICGVQAVALAEANAFIRAAGLDPEQALPILTNGAPGSPLVKTLAARRANNDRTVYFQLRLLGKDLSYAIREAETLGIELDTAAAALETIEAAAAAGHGEEDMSSLIGFLQRSAG